MRNHATPEATYTDMLSAESSKRKEPVVADAPGAFVMGLNPNALLMLHSSTRQTESEEASDPGL